MIIVDNDRDALLLRKFFKKSFLLSDDVDVALREWDGDAIGVQCVVNHFLGAVGVSDALRRKDELLHTDFDAAVAKLAEYHINLVRSTCMASKMISRTRWMSVP